MKTQTLRSPWVVPPNVNAKLVVAVHFHTAVRGAQLETNKEKRDDKALKVLSNQT